MIRTFRVQ